MHNRQMYKTQCKTYQNTAKNMYFDMYLMPKVCAHYKSSRSNKITLYRIQQH